MHRAVANPQRLIVDSESLRVTVRRACSWEPVCDIPRRDIPAIRYLISSQAQAPLLGRLHIMFQAAQPRQAQWPPDEPATIAPISLVHIPAARWRPMRNVAEFITEVHVEVIARHRPPAPFTIQFAHLDGELRFLGPRTQAELFCYLERLTLGEECVFPQRTITR
ncbi:hypothetical protein M3D15_04490 [Pseudoclavibacter alba]|uniref:Uncharacterized protein n=1 Tax=Pseudoclavibacter albus TaxID=272241 RepID=A0ABT2HWA1_9MICO|nr:hypothetical protein [Pseudoclavibacter alba]MCT2042593.1 hypothetical protein [Pseudoclavibacter alba]